MSEKEIQKVAKLMTEMGLTEITTEASILFGLIKQRFHLSKAGTPGKSAANSVHATSHQSNIESAPVAKASADAVTSPMVGVVYLVPEPNAKPFVTVGKQVQKGDTLCLVEAMKTFSPIKASKDGVVTEILVGEGDTIEFGTPLMILS